MLTMMQTLPWSWVGLMLGNVPDFVILALALSKIDAIVVPLDPTTGNLVGSVPQLLQFDSGFLPAQDTARSLLSIELPPGSRLSDTENVTEEIVKLLRTRHLAGDL